MLQFLKLNNFLLFKSQEISFDGNFTVITGETGSGKSMFIKALRFVLGEKLDNIELSNSEAFVIAEFKLNSPSLKEILSENDIELDDDRIILRRNKSKVFINDTSVTLKFLKKVTDELVEFHSQHKQLEAFNKSNCLKIIDQFTGEASLQELVASLYQQINQLNDDIALKQQEKQELEGAQEHIEYSYKELKALGPKEGEESELIEKKKLFTDKIKIIQAMESLLNIFDKEEIIQKLVKAQRNLTRLEYAQDIEAAIENSIFHLSELQNQAEIKLKDIDSGESIEIIEERLSKIKELARKYRCTSDQLVTLAEEYKAKIETLTGINEHIAAQINKRDILLKEYLVQAGMLSQARVKAAKLLEEKILQELKQLKLEQVEFIIEITSNLRPITAKGVDQARFLIKTNKGFAFAEIDEIASGGELSRIMLAFKVALAQSNEKNTIIFDEIDSGTGGAVAETLGNRMKKLAQSNQIIAISHQPQVAAKADQHLLVEKSVDLTAETKIHNLNLAEKTQEIARMLAGINVSDSAIAAAIALMKE